MLTFLQQNQEISVTLAKDLQDGVWHNIAVTVETGIIVFYVDGALSATK